MRGDETQLTTAGGAQSRERKGPRHAAPRKSLLTKLQIPAGKAMALAAMPTAVFVGMSLTPKLAVADDQLENPFAPGPCVTRSDEPEPETSESPVESPSASESAEPSATPSPSAGTDQDEDGESATAEPGPAETPSAQGAAKPQAEAPKPDPVPVPSETETKNPLDPLGVGDALKDLFDGPDKEPTATPSPSATASTPAPAPSTSAPAAKPQPEDPGKDEQADDKPAGKPAEQPADSALDKAKDEIKDAADKVGAEVEELDEKAKDEAVKDEAAEDKDGKEPFPCPTADPEALAAADLEPGIPALPDQPWILESSMLTLRGLDYEGIVKVRTSSGKIKNVLKFTAKETDIKDLHQLVVGPNGTTAHVTSDPGSTSTLRDGTVTMYTEELKGNLFGLIPVTFSPETPPPLNVPVAFFTKVKVTQAGQFGGTLTVPGLSNYYTK
ncbi:hypothetical protein [Streptomyces sp. SYSU K21746]